MEAANQPTRQTATGQKRTLRKLSTDYRQRSAVSGAEYRERLFVRVRWPTVRCLNLGRVSNAVP